jgi:hypothetical protein
VSTTTRSGLFQPALIGGAISGALSAFPIISAGNVCCCLWVVSGGAVAAYVLQQNRSTAITAGEGAIVGVLAGVIGAFVYLLVAVPIALMMAPFERVMMDRIADSGNLPPEYRDLIGSYAGTALFSVFGFLAMLCVGSIFSTIGGVLGATIFKKQGAPPPPGTIDVTATPL